MKFEKILDFASIISVVVFVIIVLQYRDLQAYIIKELGMKESALRFLLASIGFPFILQFVKTLKQSATEKNKLKLDQMAFAFTKKFDIMQMNVNDVKESVISIANSHNDLVKIVENDVIKTIKNISDKIGQWDVSKDKIKMAAKVFDDEWNSTSPKFSISPELKKAARAFYFKMRDFTLTIIKLSSDQECIIWEEFENHVKEKFVNSIDSSYNDMENFFPREFIDKFIENNSDNISDYIKDIKMSFGEGNILNDRFLKFERHSIIFLGKSLNTLALTFKETFE